MAALKNTPTKGITSDVGGMISATTNVNTVNAKSSVIAMEIRSPKPKNMCELTRVIKNNIPLYRWHIVENKITYVIYHNPG